MVIGVVHGLAGSAAVALLVLATIPSPLWSVLGLLIFGGERFAGMMPITGVNAAPFAYTARRAGWVNRLLGMAAGGLLRQVLIRKAVLNCEQLDRR